MAKKQSTKIYKGTVIEEFKVGYPSGTVTYKVGDTFETPTKASLEHLINIKKLKQQ